MRCRRAIARKCRDQQGRFGDALAGGCLVGAMTQFLLRQPLRDRDRAHTLRNVITVPWNQDSLAVAQRYGFPDSWRQFSSCTSDMYSSGCLRPRESGRAANASS